MGKKAIKIAVAMSGGVDSSLAAALLKERGFELTGVYLDCWELPGCQVDENRKDALKVGMKLGIAMKVLDFKKEYREKVMEGFFEELKKGRTPNPDVWCNSRIKFGLFLKWAESQGFDLVATGHYARIAAPIRHSKFCLHGHRVRLQDKNFPLPASVQLLQANDRKKDQSYFLCMLTQEQLKKVVFPVGEMTKVQVREEAKKRGIEVWNKKGTSGVCLVGGDLSFEELVKTRIKEHKGKVVDMVGKVIGEHKGVEFYTIGQRHGFKVKNASSDSRPLFVVAKNKKKNELVAGNKKDLEKRVFSVEGWHWIGGHVEGVRFRIRHQGELVKGKIKAKRVNLEKPVIGVAEGQIVAVYKGEECLGGGVIRG